MVAEDRTVIIHFGHEYQDPKKPIDMRLRFFRLPHEPDPDTLQTISSMIIKPEVEILPGEGYVDLQVTLQTPNAWQEGGAVNNTQFIYEALRTSVQTHT